jgi:hypothetical protein
MRIAVVAGRGGVAAAAARASRRAVETARYKGTKSAFADWDLGIGAGCGGLVIR